MLCYKYAEKNYDVLEKINARCFPSYSYGDCIKFTSYSDRLKLIKKVGKQVQYTLKIEHSIAFSVQKELI